MVSEFMSSFRCGGQGEAGRYEWGLVDVCHDGAHVWGERGIGSCRWGRSWGLGVFVYIEQLGLKCRQDLVVRGVSS